MRPSNKEAGFTLIELMIVVLIIGILITLAVPVLSQIRLRSQREACHSNLRTMDGAIQSYAGYSGGTYPATYAQLIAVLVPNFVKSEPLCPAPGGTYDVDDAGTPEMHVLCSVHGAY